MYSKTLCKLSYGMYVVNSKKGGNLNGQIANTVFQVSAEPALIAVSIHKDNLTHEYIESSKVFTASILTVDAPMKLIGHFGFKSGRQIDKFKDIKYKLGRTGVPIVLECTMGYLEAKVVNMVDVGTHTLFVGKVLEAGLLNEKEVMTYDHYHNVKQGKAPKTAPTYVKEDYQTKDSKKERYLCKLCSYIYDPLQGDPDSGIKPGTAFKDLPDGWLCPICDAPKSEFILEH
ncbi:MAG: flavin reductase [Planctomycetes bacterium]|nr:flavin reductase [Planctomycetota bacterium]